MAMLRMYVRFAPVLGLLALHCGGTPDGSTPQAVTPPPVVPPASDGGANDAAPSPRDDAGPPPAPASTGTFMWQRVIDDDNSPFFSVGSVGGTTASNGDVIMTYTLRGSTTSLGANQEGPGLLVSRVSRDNTAVRWTKLFPAKTGIRVFDVIAGDDDAVFLAGQAEGTSLELGATEIAQKAGFITRLDGASGDVVWAQEVTVPASYSLVRSIATRGTGPLVIAGHYGGGTLTYPGPDQTTLTREVEVGNYSAFVFEIDRTSGRAHWGRTFHGGAIPVASSVDLTPSGDVELALSAYGGTLTSDSGTFVTVPKDGRYSVLTRLAGATGAESALVTRKVGTSFGVQRVKALPNGDVVYGGSIGGATDVGPLAERPTVDVFVMKTNAAHEELWTTLVTGKGDAGEKSESFSDLDVDPWGRIVVSAYSQSDEALVGTTAVSGARKGDATSFYGIVAKLDASGTPLWTRGLSAGLDANVYPTRTRYAANGDVLVSAVFGHQVDFGGGMTPVDTHERGIVVRWTP